MADDEADAEATDERDGLVPDVRGDGLSDYLRHLLQLDVMSAEHLDHVWIYIDFDVRPFVRHMSRPLLVAMLDSVASFYDQGYSYVDIASRIRQSFKVSWAAVTSGELLTCLFYVDLRVGGFPVCRCRARCGALLLTG